MSTFTRRLPIYLLLDCSESMAGDAIEDVSRGVQTIRERSYGSRSSAPTARMKSFNL